MIIICVLIGTVVLIGIFQGELGKPNGWRITDHFGAVIGAIMSLIVPILVNDYIPTEVEFDSEQISKKHLVFRRRYVPKK